MSVSMYEMFIESIDYVPSELQRNFNLMTNLDERTGEVIEVINENVHIYRKSKKKLEREAIRKQTMELFEKAKSYADDKVELAVQTYELVDKHIKRLEGMSSGSKNSDTNGGVESEENAAASIAEIFTINMPIDPNEPKYCTCNNVSHGEMIACDNKDCPIEWFHFACVDLKSKPKGKWYCPECFNTTKSGKNKNKRQKTS